MRIHSKYFAALLSLMLAFAIASPSTAGQTASEVPGDAPTPNSISEEDRDILRGLLFGTGPFAEEIGNEISQVPGVDVDDYNREAEVLLEDFIESDPRKISAAVADLTSGSVNDVQHGLDSLTETYVSHLEGIVGEDALAEAAFAGTNGDVEPMACGLVAACAAAVAVVAYVTVFIHNNVGLTTVAGGGLVVALACGVWVHGCSNSSGGTSERVASEYFVADLTRAAAHW